MEAEHLKKIPTNLLGDFNLEEFENRKSDFVIASINIESNLIENIIPIGQDKHHVFRRNNSSGGVVAIIVYSEELEKFFQFNDHGNYVEDYYLWSIKKVPKIEFIDSALYNNSNERIGWFRTYYIKNPDQSIATFWTDYENIVRIDEKNNS